MFGSMAIYSVVLRADHSGHDVLVKDDVGSRHTILGFTTQAAAEAWIEEDQRASAIVPPEAQLKRGLRLWTRCHLLCSTHQGHAPDNRRHIEIRLPSTDVFSGHGRVVLVVVPQGISRLTAAERYDDSKHRRQIRRSDDCTAPTPDLPLQQSVIPDAMPRQTTLTAKLG
jgi:hypothetical protein